MSNEAIFSTDPSDIFFKFCTIVELVNAPVPLRPAVLRLIPEPPGSSRFMDRDEPGENDVFLPKNLDGQPSRP